MTETEAADRLCACQGDAASKIGAYRRAADRYLRFSNGTIISASSGSC